MIHYSAILKTPRLFTWRLLITQRMAARLADVGAGLFKLVAPDDGLTQWSARRMVGKMANDVRRAGPTSTCRRKPSCRHCCRMDRLSPPLQTAGAALYSASTFCLAGRYGRCARAAILPVARCRCLGESKLAQADKHTNAGMLRERFNYYCEKVVKGFYKNHFLRFDRQIVLVDCLQPLNSGPQAFNDMRLALTQLMQSFHYGQRTLFRRLFSCGYR